MINVELYEANALHITLHLDPETLSVSVTEILDGGTTDIVRQRSFWLFRGDAELFELGEIPAAIRRINERGYSASLWSIEEFRKEVFSKFLTTTRA